MLFCIAVVFMQIVLEAYILGTLFHYIVKKDPAVENFRTRLVWEGSSTVAHTVV